MEIAIALVLWRDFKKGAVGSKSSIEVTNTMFEFAQQLGVLEEVIEMLSKLPPMKIEPKY